MRGWLTQLGSGLKDLVNRLGGWPRLLIIGSAILFAVSLQPFIGTDGWAGLGQWVGGLGALFAAWAALDIAKQEARRENDRDAEVRRVQAYFIRAGHGGVAGPSGIKVRVKNAGKDPVIGVQVVAMHMQGSSNSRIAVHATSGTCEVLLPDAVWEPWTQPDSFGDNPEVRSGTSLVEIVYKDVAGTWWRRVGDRPPVADPTLSGSGV